MFELNRVKWQRFITTKGLRLAQRIYIVEDDRALAAELARLLELHDYQVGICDDFSRADKLALAFDPDCVLLDLKLPGADGLAICRAIRAASSVPIIVLTSSVDEFTEVTSLNLGANDFVAKPYRPAVLLARIAAATARMETAASNVLEYHGVMLDADCYMVRYEGRSSELTRNEQRILALLMRNAGRVVTRSDIMCELWESDAFIDDNTLTVNMNRLRKVLSDIGVPPGYIQTQRGVGYFIGKQDV